MCKMCKKNIKYKWTKNRNLSLSYIKTLFPFISLLMTCVIIEPIIMLFAYISTSESSISILAKKCEVAIILVAFFMSWIIEAAFEVHYKNVMIIYNVKVNNNCKVHYGKIAQNLINTYMKRVIDHLEILSIILGEVYITHIMPMFNSVLALAIIFVTFFIFILLAETHLQDLKHNKKYVTPIKNFRSTKKNFRSTNSNIPLDSKRSTNFKGKNSNISFNISIH